MRRVMIDDTANIVMASQARIWNHWLGGSDNFAVDRATGDRFAVENPGLVERVRTTRQFLARAVRYLAVEAGIRQFIDVGSGLPTAGNTHEIVQWAVPGGRVVYADNDPQVVSYARGLLTATTTESDSVAVVEADLRQPDVVLAEAARTLDLSQPVALVLSGILGHVPTYREACDVVQHLTAALPSGSYLLAHDISDIEPDWHAVQARHNDSAPLAYHLRTPEQIGGYFAGLELVDPGIGALTSWRPDSGAPYSREWTDLVADVVGGVGRKP